MVVGVATLVGTPTGGALLKQTDEAHFRTLIVFCGVVTAVGTAVLGMAGVVGSKRVRRALRHRGAADPEVVEKEKPMESGC